VQALDILKYHTEFSSQRFNRHLIPFIPWHWKSSPRMHLTQELP